MPARASNDEMEPAPPRTARERGVGAFKVLGLLATILVVAWSCLTFPSDTMNQLADPSWAAVLIHAHATGMQFGHDLVFTYCPLGLLSIACFSPDIAAVRILSEVALALLVGTGLSLVVWRMTIPWRLLTLVFFILVATPLHWGGAALFLDLGVFVWGMLCFLESDRRLNVFALGLVAVVVVGALVKFTFFVSGVFTVGILMCDLALRRKYLMAAGVVIFSVATFMGAWVSLGQNFSGLSEFLSSSYTMADGYNQAMGQRFVNITMLGGMTVATAAAIFIRCFGEANTVTRANAIRRTLLVVWVTGLLFLNWKYIAVRGDEYHLKMLFGFMPIVALCAEAIPGVGQRAVTWSRIAMFACLFLAVMMIRSQIATAYFPLTCVQQACKHLTTSLAVLVHPTRYIQEKTDAFRAEQKVQQLPKVRAVVGQGTVDVFGQNQAVVFANGLNYKPRPIFQSYFAYNRAMIERNERYYMSPDAPDYVLFKLEAIDDRFPPLEDSYVLRDLLINYKPLLTELGFVLLKKAGTESAHLTLLKEGTIHFGEKLAWPEQSATNLWLELAPQPTLAGRLQKFFYKPQDLQLVSPRPSKTAPFEKFNAPAAMLSAGFLFNPGLVTGKDVMKLYAGEKVATESYSLELVPAPLSTWQPEIPYRLYRIDNQLGGK